MIFVWASDHALRIPFDELEIEFVKATADIGKALKHANINVYILIEQLCSISLVKYKHVPLFDSDVFAKVNTIDDLWKNLDWDILIIVLQLANSNDIYEKVWDEKF